MEKKIMEIEQMAQKNAENSMTAFLLLIEI